MRTIIVLIAETDGNLKNTVYILLKEGKEIGQKINEAKIKYIILIKQNHRTNLLKVED